MTVPTNLLAALRGLAVVAKAANDDNALGLLTQMYELADFGLGSAYTAAATSTTAIWPVTGFYPLGSITPSFDGATQAGPAMGTIGSPY